MFFKPDKDDFASDWKKVDDLENKGLTEDAKKQVELIYQKALAANNQANVVKALLYRYKYAQTNEEYSEQKAIAGLTAEIEKATAPTKNVLQSILADAYWQYFNSNRYNILERTALSDDNAAPDFETWDAVRFSRTITDLHLAALQNTELLQNTKVDAFDDIIVKGDSTSRRYRATLYDFLAHRAIDYFSNDQANISKAADQFQVSDPAAFGNTETFLAANFTTTDPLSTKYYALKLLQDVSRFQQKDAQADALIDVELKRLDFALAASSLPNKNDLHFAALEALEKRYASQAASASVSFRLAQWHNDKGGEYQAYNKPEVQGEKKRAMEICESIIKKFPTTIAAKNAQLLQQQIQSKSISIQVEETTEPEKALRALISYQNISKVYGKVALVTPEMELKMKKMKRENEQIDYLLDQKAVKTFTNNLPTDNDYQTHSTEIKIEALPAGKYVLFTGTSDNFSYKGNALAYQYFYATNLSTISKKLYADGYKNTIFVVDRRSGKPLQGVNIRVFTERWDYQKQENIETELSKGTSEEDGSFRYFAPNDYYGNVRIALAQGNDRYETTQYSYGYGGPSTENSQPTTFFFTDRAIYRPGQTLFFKGIMVKQGKDNSLVTNQATTVTLYDVNGQEVTKLDLKTNEYGSFNGKFTLPVGLLNGQMRIENGNGSAYFSVEEYKRPKFEVVFKPVEGSYRINETVTVKGTATGYAGNSISDAKVSYRVVRRAKFPWWWCWWRPMPQSPEMEITNGTITTNAEGLFSIDFKALPNIADKIADKPQYSYEVIADVTDINGETQSQTTSVEVGYVALQANVTIADVLDKNNEQQRKIAVSTTNLNGQAEPTDVTVSMVELQQPDRILRKRLWERPDKFVLSKEEYIKLFPNDPYNNEDDMATWKTGDEIFRKTFNTGKENSIELAKLSNAASGKYVVTLTAKDKYGEAVEWKQYITVYGSKDKKIATQEAFWATVNKQNAEPTEQVSTFFGSALKNATILYEVEHNNQLVKREFIPIGELQKHIDETVKEEHRGNFFIHLTSVALNRQQTIAYTIVVPWSNKDLKVEMSTFRNKILPGAKEAWTVKISGAKSEKVAAELLAGMYDASLDAFVPHSWNMSVYPTYSSALSTTFGDGFGVVSNSLLANNWNDRYYGSYNYPRYDQLNLFDFYLGRQYYSSMYMRGGGRAVAMSAPSMMKEESMSMDSPSPSPKMTKNKAMKDGDDKQEDALMEKKGSLIANEPNAQTVAKPAEVQIRKNLQETAFFMPELRTNEQGEVLLSFTAPEALTRWKLMLLAHTKNLEIGTKTEEIVTQKELMVMPNPPRFLREGDEMYFATKISNLTDKALDGTATLKLFDATTNTPVEAAFKLADAKQNFKVAAKQSTAVQWKIQVPETIQAITYQVIAQAGSVSDGEENALPILTNRMLVTETLPLPVRGKGTKSFTFNKLADSESSSTLKHQALTLEFTSQPAWYAIQALPYMMEYPYECSEQIFSRYYANSIASHIANSDPRVKTVFDRWKTDAENALKNNTAKGALFSNLEKNEDLKYLLLQETPWVMAAQNETERKNRLAVLFDLERMTKEQRKAEEELIKRQNPDGSFSWFPNMYPSRYITQHIVCGMGHLDKLGVTQVRQDAETWLMIQKGMNYLDAEMQKDYDNLLKYKTNLKQQNIGYEQIQYLYTRSYFNNDVPLDKKYETAYNYYKKQAETYWLQQSKYMQAMIALSVNRLDSKDSKIAFDILKSLKQNATQNEEMGMYFKDNTGGWYWYQAPIETQALMIEAFDEVTNDTESVEGLKVWLLKQKQTQDWKTTKATAEACYALLRTGKNWLTQDDAVEINIGRQTLNPKTMPELNAEAGTGYFKTTWKGSEIRPEMGKVSVTKKDEGVSWGALYWQYFEQLDKITFASTPLNIKKQLFLKTNTKNGEVLTPLSDNAKIKVGDVVKVRIEIRVDRDMEYVHLKDMRAAGFEPINVVSQYKYQDGLGYYESTKDAATNFFMGWLPKGTYVFEYPLRASQRGNFSNGITTMQCMYAPEFTSHSEGIRVTIEK